MLRVLGFGACSIEVVLEFGDARKLFKSLTGGGEMRVSENRGH